MKPRRDVFSSFEDPIRSEIFSATRLESCAENLARAQAVTDDPHRGRRLLSRMRQNGKVLEKSYLAILEAVHAQRAITPAAEWLIDNFHIVRSQLQEIHESLPKSYYRELPKLASGEHAGFPRVYAVATAFVAHTDSRFDPDLLRRFLLSYQKAQPLTIGELWAVPVTLRVILIENLRRLSARIVGSQIARAEADRIADELLGLREGPARRLDKILEELRQKDKIIPAFAAQLLQRLRFQNVNLDPLLAWLDERLARQGTSADEIVASEHNSQTAANATVRNIITSSRLMSAFNWQNFFEEVSLVDQVLRRHPLYSQLDFSTRDRYRQAVEELAFSSPRSELDVAGKAVERDGDPGLSLIGREREAFESELGFHAPFRLRVSRFYMRNGTFLYLGAIAALMLVLLLIPWSVLRPIEGLSPTLKLLILCGLFPISEIAIAAVNRLTIALLGPRPLPRLGLEHGIPAECRTFVVVPTMFPDPHKVGTQLENLEIHYLSNPDGEAYFALLTDFLDSKLETTQQDAHILEAARAGVASLNAQYGPAPSGLPRFYVFHRRRQFNPSEGKWIGWERKRGKLHEFNQLLLGSKTTSYIPLGPEPLEVPPDVRYVLTLDADTRLPKGTVAQLVGTMAHPLNHAKIDPRTGRVTEGYGILQPRITPTLPSTMDSTIFQRLSTGDSGIDPYASAVSDVYQDLFGEGSFTGKGLYDLRAFEKSLEGRIPENSLLSHDLFEGSYARCGFLSNVEMFEDFPSHTLVASSRNHRWIRGDWQLLPWIFGPRGKHLSLMCRWKMFDNLRRSLVAPMTFLTIVLGLALTGPRSPVWLILGLVGLSVTTVVNFLAELWPRRKAPVTAHLHSIFQDAVINHGRFFLNLVLLPSQAWVSIDAISRALFRTLLTRKKMLEWTTAAQARAMAGHTIKSFFKGMRGGCGLAIVSALFVAVFDIGNLLWSAPFFILWIGSPALAKLFSQPPPARLFKPLDGDEIEYLQLTARKIWRFFTTFVTEEDHYLPPDNFQEDPDPVVAHRSSPTNFGLYLLSTIAARDFGWIGTWEMADRLELTLKNMRALPRHDGHFYNWYETRDARALDPRYISAVDNGNLAGHLIAVAQGCLEALHRPVLQWGAAIGVSHTLRLFEQSLKTVPRELSSKKNQDFEKSLDEVRKTLFNPPMSPLNTTSHWETLQAQTQRLCEHAQELAKERPGQAWDDCLSWVKCLHHDVKSNARDLMLMIPWLEFATNSFYQQNDPDFDQLLETVQGRLHFPDIPLNEVERHCRALLEDLGRLERMAGERGYQVDSFAKPLRQALETAVLHANLLTRKLREIFRLSRQTFDEMDFGLLFDPVRKLFSIGYRVNDQELDASYYDLLASEARLTSFIAIAKGDVPPSHWFRLGRGLTLVEKGAALVSWSGSMFEYLMPSLVMDTPQGSLIDQTCRLAVRRQMSYGRERGVPWGISESAYNKRDLHLTYQYSNFGVPDLGLQRGLGSDLVIAPYATILASMYEPAASVANLRRLEKHGALGPYGFYEAIDMTPSRLPERQSEAVIKAYMTHHQGMSLVAIANVLKNGIMRERFHAQPFVQATDLLLQERTPRNQGVTLFRPEIQEASYVREEVESLARQYHDPNRPVPTTQILGSNDYSVMITSAGSGYSRSRDIAVTRWREDATLDSTGTYFYLRDCRSNQAWSAGYQPTCAEPDSYEVTFAEDRARIQRTDRGISCEMEVYVSPEDPAEVRKLVITNKSDRLREIEITSYAEIVIAPQGADVAHPAFSNLFVQTEFVPELDAILATRRPRSAKEKPVWMAHVLLRDRFCFQQLQFETDRARFLGRGRTVRKPAGLHEGATLSGTDGAVLDPVFSLRTRIRLEEGATSHLYFTTLVGSSREDVIRLAEKFRDRTTFERATNLVWTQSQVKLHYLNIEPNEAHLFQRLATRLLYSDPSLRPSSDILKRSSKDVTGLWGHGISGDHPIILVRVDDAEDRGIIRQLLKAHEYLTMKGLVLDLVILNDKAASYVQELQHDLEMLVHNSLISAGVRENAIRGKIFVLRSDLVSHEDRLLLYASSRAIFSSRHGSLSEQVRRVKVTTPKPKLQPKPQRLSFAPPSLPVPDLRFFNETGGFSPDGKEYVVSLRDGQRTPLPWINVIANEEFGFHVSESGSGSTWSQNGRENQLTPWSNDPVSDPAGEAFYIRDVESGELWTPTALPVRIENASYIVRHGQGYSRFEHLSHDIRSELTQFVPVDASVKVSKLVLENKSRQTRRLEVSAYVEWLLGFARATMAPTTITDRDEMTGALFAFNPRSQEFGTRVAFAAFREEIKGFTCDRSEFLGRNGCTAEPKSLLRGEPLSGHSGGAMDPCAAQQIEFTLGPGEKKEICFYLGQGSNRTHAQQILQKVRQENPDELLKKVMDRWDQILGKVQVKTPDAAMNFMLNRWLLYQTLACRFWARTAFYQAGGAYGFRDQLQDSMALSIALPQTARTHILRAAARQFVEGDVQHWWHPPSGRGVRTHFSDDLLWLPYVVEHYLRVSGDDSILNEEISFLEGPQLRPDQEDSYFTPQVSHLHAPLYEHCARTLDRSLGMGAHGLPFIGAGDWNDGMNRVGHDGRGESVWLGWFLASILKGFAEVAEARGDRERASKWRSHSQILVQNIESQSWDGDWYRRAYFDDGTPIGSKDQPECRIDSLTQTWAVLTRLGSVDRAVRAMDSVEKILVRPDDKMILLFTPAFDKTPHDPGYIKGYLPGVRENGGQYTHAAVWCVMAETALGRADRAYELFSLLNPVEHARNKKELSRYKAEPYVLAADVYSVPPHTGRGGWTWYTGSSGWMYRAGVESILGLSVHGTELALDPQAPSHWNEFAISYRHGKSVYEIQFERSPGGGNRITRLTLDGSPLPGNRVPLVDDGRVHRVEATLGAPEENAAPPNELRT